MASSGDKSAAGPGVFTSSWATRIDETLYCRIGISRSTPRGQKGYRRYPKLNPGPWFRSIPDERDWARRYNLEMLSPLDAKATLGDLLAMAEGRSPVLLCWEPPQPGDDYCHRGLVAAWLMDEAGVEVFELGLEQEGCSHRHPKLPRSLRRS